MDVNIEEVLVSKNIAFGKKKLYLLHCLLK